MNFASSPKDKLSYIYLLALVHIAPWKHHSDCDIQSLLIIAMISFIARMPLLVPALPHSGHRTWTLAVPVFVSIGGQNGVTRLITSLATAGLKILSKATRRWRSDAKLFVHLHRLTKRPESGISRRPDHTFFCTLLPSFNNGCVFKYHPILP